jgi:hypothetical protein
MEVGIPQDVAEVRGMKIEFIIIDDHGKRFIGEALLVPAPQRKKTGKGTVSPEKGPTLRIDDLMFSLNTRAFMKKYSRGLKAPSQFVLLLARLAGGDRSVEVRTDEVAAHWNRMKTVIGVPFHRMYALRAKENGWVDTPKRGTYVLSTNWREIFDKDYDRKGD